MDRKKAAGELSRIFVIALSMFGLKKASARLTTKTVADSSLNAKKWKGERIKERELKIGEARERKTPQIEDIVGKKANELTAVPDDYVLVHYTDGERHTSDFN